MKKALWTVQVLLALVFLSAGGSKFAMSVEEMTRQMPVHLSGSFLHLIGTCEVLGAIGLILPGLLHIKPGLTPLAAAGLAIITVGATVITLMGGMIATALFPLATALLSAFVAYGRWRLAPL
jgi:uncharacterized membrane protein YphA (DoxX/SURF4 family)